MSTKSKNQYKKRDANDISNRRLRSYENKTNTKIRDILRSRRDPLTLFEDRRQYYPERYTEPARSFTSTRHRLQIRSKVYPSKEQAHYQSPTSYVHAYLPAQIGFARPNEVLICVRRKIRREVMFAKRKAGRSGGQNKRKLNEYSMIRC